MAVLYLAFMESMHNFPHFWDGWLSSLMELHQPHGVEIMQLVGIESLCIDLGMPSKKKSPYGGTLSQPHITPSPPSKVGTKIEGTFFRF